MAQRLCRNFFSFWSRPILVNDTVFVRCCSTDTWIQHVAIPSTYLSSVWLMFDFVSPQREILEQLSTCNQRSWQSASSVLLGLFFAITLLPDFAVFQLGNHHVILTVAALVCCCWDGGRGRVVKHFARATIQSKAKKFLHTARCILINSLCSLSALPGR